MNFLNKPDSSLIQLNNLDIEEDDTRKCNRRIYFRVAVTRRGKKREKNLDIEEVHGKGIYKERSKFIFKIL